MTDSNIKSIASACAPAAATSQAKSQNNRIWSLTQAGSGIAGRDARSLACVFDRQTDEQGNFRGEIPYPVIGDIQTYPAVSGLLRPVEWRSVVTTGQISGLLYRKQASPGFSNSWLDSAEIAVQTWAGNWGRVTSDRNAGVYRFEALNLLGQGQPTFPDIDELINELLADYVIDSLDHPVLQQLMKPGFGPAIGATADHGDDSEEDIDEIY